MSEGIVKGWNNVFEASENEIAFKLEHASVRASGWAMGRSDDDIAQEAARRLKDGKGIEYKLEKKA